MLNRRGFGMVDAIVGLFLLAVAGVLFTAAFPIGFSATRQAGETKQAVTIAQLKLEQVKGLGYESLSYTNLRSSNPPTIDDDPQESPYEFTSVDNLTSSLGSAVGTMSIADDTSSVKRVTVVIRWQGANGIARSVTLNTFIADKRPWRPG